MTKKNDDEVDFSALFADAKPVFDDKYTPSRAELAKLKKNKINRQLAGIDKQALSKHARSQQNASVALSDEFEAHWPEDKPIKYLRSFQAPQNQTVSEHDMHHIRKDLLKQLQRGMIPPDIEIDLHGLTSKQAKDEIIAVIFEAVKRRYSCINIIHGHGNGVLKQKIPNWLVQHPDVTGFVRAPKMYGGQAGLLVLVNKL